MKKILFNKKIGLLDLVLSGKKNQTRRVFGSGQIYNSETDEMFRGKLPESFEKMCIEKYARYKVGEVVAIAQSYRDAGLSPFPFCEAGWNNSMFVKPELMPHHIRITDVKIEELQDISDEDCLSEGVCKMYHSGGGFWCYNTKASDMLFHTPQEAFAAIINKTCGKGTWKNNPYVFVYSFELVD